MMVVEVMIWRESLCSTKKVRNAELLVKTAFSLVRSGSPFACHTHLCNAQRELCSCCASDALPARVPDRAIKIQASVCREREEYEKHNNNKKLPNAKTDESHFVCVTAKAGDASRSVV